MMHETESDLICLRYAYPFVVRCKKSASCGELDGFAWVSKVQDERWSTARNALPQRERHVPTSCFR